jgi:Predicted integral membrane protein (DUF2269)
MSAEIPGELAVTNYELSLFAHISAAIVGLGAAFVELLTYPVALRMDPRHLPYKHRLQLVINALLALPALVVLLATGLYQVSEFDFDLGDFWLSGTMAIVLALALMLGAYFIPEDRRLQAMVERDVAASGDGPVSLSSRVSAPGAHRGRRRDRRRPPGARGRLSHGDQARPLKPAAADHRPPPPPLRPNASAPRFVTSSGTSVMAAAASACDGSDPLPTR